MMMISERGEKGPPTSPFHKTSSSLNKGPSTLKSCLRDGGLSLKFIFAPHNSQPFLKSECLPKI